MKGVIVYAFHKGELDAAHRFFGLNKTDKNSIKHKYHVLAKKYHPDRHNGNDTHMKKLNHHYQILKEVYVL